MAAAISLAQESRTRSSSLEHRSLITAFACRSLLSLEDEPVLESDHTVVSECLESNNNKSYNIRDHLLDSKQQFVAQGRSGPVKCTSTDLLLLLEALGDRLGQNGK